jgi:hypothetical protein
MSNIYNEQRAEQMFEEMVEDNISKESLVEVIDFIKKYLMKNITSKWVDEFVKVDNMALLKLLLDKVRKIDDNATMKVDHYIEKNKDFWIEGAD